MAYQGVSPYLFANNLTNVQLLDDISGLFNGFVVTFNLTIDGVAFRPEAARGLFIVLGGIVQDPDTDYTVSGSQITFTTAPAFGLTFAGRNIYGLNAINNVNDGVITPAKLSTGGPTWNTGGTVTVSGDLNVTGSFNSGTQGLFWGDNEPANFGNSNDLQIYHDGSHSYISESSGTGDLRLVSTRTLIRDENDTNHCIIANSGGSVDLYHNGTKKFETTSGGIFVSGTARVPNATAFTSSDSGGTERWLMYMSGGVSPSSGNKLIIGNPLNDDVILFTNNTERLCITSGGNVGIGTTNPGGVLHVYGGSASRAGMFSSTDTTSYNPTSYSQYQRVYLQGGSATDAYNGIGFTNSSNSEGFIGFVQNTSGYGDFVVQSYNGSYGEKLRIKSNGNIGIGTTNPSEKLEVTGKFRLFDGGYPYIDIGITTSNYFRLIHDNPNDRFYIGKNNNATLVITGSNNVEPGADATQDLGSPTKRWANIYSADLQLSNEGSSNDVDGTWGQYTIQEGENDLFLINRRNGKKYKFVLQEVN